MNSHLHAGQRALTGLLLSSTLSFCSHDGQFNISPLDEDEAVRQQPDAADDAPPPTGD